MPTWWQGPERLAYSAEVPHSPARFAVHGLPGAITAMPLGISRVWTGSLRGTSPSGSHVELAQASTSPTGRVDAAVADGGLVCLGSSCVLHRRRVVEMGGWKTARHLGYAEDSPSLPGAFSATAWAHPSNESQKTSLCPCHVSWPVRRRPVHILSGTGDGPFPFEAVQTQPTRVPTRLLRPERRSYTHGPEAA